jgi:hypothetical protein
MKNASRVGGCEHAWRGMQARTDDASDWSRMLDDNPCVDVGVSRMLDDSPCVDVGVNGGGAGVREWRM